VSAVQFGLVTRYPELAAGPVPQPFGAGRLATGPAPSPPPAADR
jgi:hypothetical protein